MNAFLLKISSPDGDLFCGEATNLSVRGTEGELAIMAGHIPFITVVKPCDCYVEFPDGSRKSAKTDGGILTVATDKTVFLTGSFHWE